MLKAMPPLAVVLTLAALPAAAQQSQCAPYETVAAALASEYHEAPVARMLSDRGFAIEILASADGETFTVLAVNANGTACGLATGSAFALVPASAAPTPGQGS